MNDYLILIAEFTKFVGALDSEVQKSSASEGRLYSHESTMDTMTRMKHRFWLSRESLSPFVPKAFGCLVTGRPTLAVTDRR